MQNADVLKASLAALGPHGVAFADDVLADMRSAHATESTALGFTSGATLFAALERFVALPPATATDASQSPVDVAFADSLMKVFAKRLGRVKWTPGMALAWNAALRDSGSSLRG